MSFLIFITVLLTYRLLYVVATRVPHDDPRIQYFPDACDTPCAEVCDKAWSISCLSDGTTFHRARSQNAYATFSFQSSDIAWYTRLTSEGGKAVVYLDDQSGPTFVNTNSPQIDDAYAIFQRTDLDLHQTHTLTVASDGGAWTEGSDNFVDILYFEYNGDNDSINNSSSILSITSTTISTPVERRAENTVSQSSSTPFMQVPNDVASQTTDTASLSSDSSLGQTFSTSSILPTSSIIGIACGCFGLVCIVTLLAYLGWRRRRHMVISAQTIEPQFAEPLPPPPSIAKLHDSRKSHSPSLVSRYQFNGADPFNTHDPLFNRLPGDPLSTPRLTYADLSIRSMSKLSSPLSPDMLPTVGQVPVASNSRSARQSRVSRLWARFTMSGKRESQRSTEATV